MLVNPNEKERDAFLMLYQNATKLAQGRRTFKMAECGIPAVTIERFVELGLLYHGEVYHFIYFTNFGLEVGQKLETANG